MTDIQLCDFLRDYLRIDTPSTPLTNLTISAVSGNTIQLSGTLGAADAWVGGILEITDPTSPAYRQRAVIMGNNGAVLTIAYRFNRFKAPKVGDTVKVYGGPLAEARVYLFEPDSVEDAVEAGIKFFVVVNCTGGEVDQVSLGTADRAIHNAEAVYGIEIAAETLDLTGTASRDDVYRVAVDLPTLRQQVMCIVHWFRNQSSNGSTGRGKIEFAYASYQRTGSPRRLRGAIMQFDIVIR